MSQVYNQMIELQVLNYVFSKNSMQIIILNGITDEYFTTYKEHFVFVKNFYDTYNQLPSRETFQGKFSDKFEWLIVSDPEDYLVQKLKEAKLYRDMVKEYKAIGELLKSEKSDVALDRMQGIVQTYLKQNQGKCVDLIDDANQRYDSYIERVNSPESSFITTGLKELDDVLGGWDMKNETALICARTGFGKSWWLIYFAMQAQRQGMRVGFYSGEMEIDLVGYRFDTFLGNLSNGSLTHGNQNIGKEYKEYIENLKNTVKGHLYCVTPDMLGGQVTVSKLRAFVEKYDLQMLCIDQFSLLDDEKGAKNPREQAVNISKSLRNLQRMKKIPIIQAVQLNREDTTDNGPSTRNISESDRIGQDATTVIFVERKNDNVTLTVGKSRNAKTGDKLTYAWNVNMGILRYLPTERDAKNGEQSEALLEEYNDSEKSDSVF